METAKEPKYDKFRKGFCPDCQSDSFVVDRMFLCCGRPVPDPERYPAPKLKIECIGCGVKFRQTDARQKYCTRVCFRKSSYRTKAKTKNKRKQCLRCGVTFFTFLLKKVFCSKKCLAPRKEPIEYKCTQCSARFFCAYDYALYCGNKCRSKAARERRKNLV